MHNDPQKKVRRTIEMRRDLWDAVKRYARIVRRDLSASTGDTDLELATTSVTLSSAAAKLIRNALELEGEALADAYPDQLCDADDPVQILFDEALFQRVTGLSAPGSVSEARKGIMLKDPPAPLLQAVPEQTKEMPQRELDALTKESAE